MSSVLRNLPIKISGVARAIRRVMCQAVVLAVVLAASNRCWADIALVDTVRQKGFPSITSSISSPTSTSVTISNFVVSAMANVLVVLVEDKGASAVNSEPATLAWGSQTVLRAIIQDNSDTTRRGLAIYYLFNPTPGTNNITVSVANNPADVEVTVYTLSGVDTSVAPKNRGTPASGASAALSFTVPGVVAGSWAAVNATWASTSPFPVITGTGGTATTTSFIATIAGTSSIMTAGYIAGLSGGTDTFAATWSGSQKNNFAVAVFTPLTTALNITATSISPNKVLIGSNVVLSVTASSTAGLITNMTVDAHAIGGPSVLPLLLSAGNVYTNSVTVGGIAGGKILPVTIQDGANNSVTGSLQVVVQTLADAQLDAYNAAYMLPPRADGRIYFAQGLTNRNADTTGWTHAIDIQAECDAYERTGDPQQRQLVHSLCQTWLLQSHLPWDGDHWNDDVGWFCLIMIRGYQMTGNTDFLNASEYGFNMAFDRGWDTNYNGGGIWELQPSSTTNPHKEPLSCDSLEQAALMIYQSTGDTNFLNRAVQIYSWVRTNLFNPSTGAVYNDIYTNGTVDTGVNLYNEGTFVDCANLLHNITGEQRYYDDALKVVEYARNHSTVNGIFSNGGTYLYTWAAEFARGLGHFVKDNNLWSTYYPWMQANVNAAWNSRRTDYNVSWNQWTKPTPTTNDLSVGWAVNAVVIMQLTPASQPGLVVCTNRLSGSIIGTAGSWSNQGNTIAKVFDGNLNTFFDAPDNSGDWVGLDFGVGVSNVIGQINYWPRAGWSQRMLGGVFQAANSLAFNNPVTLFTIATAPPEGGVITSQMVTNPAAFRYVRYVGPANSACNVAELQFFSPNPPSLPLAPRFTGFQLSGATLSLSASNGTVGGSWTLLQSTNLALPLSQWQTNIAGTFDENGNLTTNIANMATNSREFYIFRVP